MNRWSRISMCSNIELFDRYAASVLAELYQAFPFHAELAVPDLLSSWGDIQEIEVDEVGMLKGDEHVTRRADLLVATIDWLQEAGYLTYQHRNAGYFSRVRLTAKGLEVLKSVPESLQKKKMLGDFLVESVRSGARDAAKTALSAIITQGIRCFGMDG